MTFKRNNYNACKIVAILLVLFGLFDFSIFSQKQVVVKITNVPDYTPQEDTLYLVTSIDNWALSKENRRFIRLADGTYSLKFTLPHDSDFEYKINRGNWKTVEGNDFGDYLPNRNFTFSNNKFDIEITIKSWQDLHKKFLPSVEVLITSVPANTPVDAKLFISGSFNNWDFSNPNYELTKLRDGSYKGVITTDLKSFEYKISRGSSQSIEGRWDGGVRSNRVYKTSTNKQPGKIQIKIASWEDLSSGRFWKMLLFFSLALNALQVLCLLIYLKYSKTLIFIVAFSIVAFVVNSIYNNPGIFNFLPHGYSLPACLYSFIGPWMFNWLISINNPVGSKNVKIINTAFIMPFFSFLVMAHLITFSYTSFRSLSIINGLNVYFLTLYSFGMGLNMIYSYKSRNYIKIYKSDIPYWILKLFKAIHINWHISLLIGMMMYLAYMFGADIKFLTEWLEKIFWLNIGIVIIYIEFILLINESGFIAKIRTKDKINKDFTETQSWESFKKKLTILMENKTLYVNPDLTLSDLANHLGTNTHYVSKILNEGFGKNFADFINNYRINAFIKAIKTDPDSKSSYISVAYNVGFNSKSAFNRAFKKITGSTPSEYFNL